MINASARAIVSLRIRILPNGRTRRQPSAGFVIVKKLPFPAAASRTQSPKTRSLKQPRLVHACVLAQAGDLVLHLQLAALELDHLQVVDRRMRERFIDL